MSIEEEDRPRRDVTDLLPIALAMILTAAAIGLCFFKFSAGAPQPGAAATPPTEVTVGIGGGSTIQPPPAVAPEPAHP